MVLDAAFLSNNNFLLMIIVEILIFYIRKLREKILQKKTNLSACTAHHRYRLNKNIVIIVGLISTVTNKILHHFINKAFFSIFGRDKLIFLSTQVIVILK